ncbi:MAG: hypothetical protein H7122_07560 [Chitinophagaceae bacterium]|nr:hypothetical protein [Chitinophagaceae bacterium]
MKIYLTGPDAVSDLHKNGFTNDFQLLGNELWFVQEKLSIRVGEFIILECHKITERGSSVIVYGIIATYHNIKGILISHYKGPKMITPSVLVKSLMK